MRDQDVHMLAKQPKAPPPPSAGEKQSAADGGGCVRGCTCVCVCVRGLIKFEAANGCKHAKKITARC